jgi:hypothetical protein
MRPVTCGPHSPRQPPPVSLAPIGLACPMPRRRPSLGTGTRLPRVWSFLSIWSCRFLSLYSKDNTAPSFFLYCSPQATDPLRISRPGFRLNSVLHFLARVSRTPSRASAPPFPISLHTNLPISPYAGNFTIFSARYLDYRQNQPIRHHYYTV